MKIDRPLRICDLLQESNLAEVEVDGNTDARITGLETDSRKVQKNDLFVAISGTRIDSHMLIHDAVAAGASAVLTEREVGPLPGVTVIKVKNSRNVLGHLAHACFGNPSRAMNLVGITGTNGKTTTCNLLYSILRNSGHIPGYVGTLGSYFAGEHRETRTTTPGPLELAKIFKEMESSNVDSVAMECSSHAIDQDRIGGLSIRIGVLLAITQDHLDYHGTFENYKQVKFDLMRRYVSQVKGSVGCFNLDDENVAEFYQEYKGDSLGFSMQGRPEAHVKATDIVYSPFGTQFTLQIGKESYPVRSPLIGEFNVSNILAASSAATCLGVGGTQLVSAIEVADPTPGRFEKVDEGQPFTVIVDYAHTPDALERTLRTCRKLCQGRLIVVFGCGGDRDKRKRPIMGLHAGNLADYVVVTTDNPRFEDPSVISRSVVEGLLQTPLKSSRYEVIDDREAAIQQAICLAGDGDVVLIAGKGHEKYQEVEGVFRHFDDRRVAENYLRDMEKKRLNFKPGNGVAREPIL